MNTQNNNKDFLGKQKKRFSLDGQKFFITLSRNDTTKEDAMDRMKELFKDNLEYAIVSREIHKADNIDTTLNKSQYHLHIIFKTLKRLQISKADCWDIIGGHGEYEAVRCEEYAIKYVIKDGDYISYNIDTSKYLQSKAKKTTTKTTKGIFKQITDAITIDTEYKDILLTYPEICLQHGARVKAFIKDYQEAHRPSYRDWKMNVSYRYGKTGTGKSQGAYEGYSPKTHYIMMRPNGGSMWFEGYTGQETIIIDDFSCKDYKLTDLLILLDRYAMTLPIKGGSTPMISKNIIITSNYSPHSIYNGCGENRNALYRRINTYTEYISQDIQHTYTNILDIPRDTYNNIIEQSSDDEDDIARPVKDITKDTIHIHTFNTKETNANSPFRCHICGDTFRTHQYLKVHSRIHKEDKNKENTDDTFKDTDDTDKDITKNTYDAPSSSPTGTRKVKRL